MECTGKLHSVNRDWKTGKIIISFELNEEPTEEINIIGQCEKLNIVAKKHRNKRSLDSNAYCWVLLQKIAEAIGSDKWTVYLDCLQRYSRAFSHVIVKPEAVWRMKQLYRTCVDLGEINVNGKTGHQLQVYYGSSEFDTKEMAVFIDGIVSECKELGIETLPPHELERMKAAWGNGKSQ